MAEPIHRSMRVPADHPVFAGHFPNRPIVPGVMLLEWVLEEMGTALGRRPATLRLRESKFFTPLSPGDSAELRCEPGEARCSFEIRCGGARIARGLVEWSP